MPGTFTLQLAESYLTGPLFRQILARIEALAWHPTWSGSCPGGGCAREEGPFR